MQLDNYKLRSFEVNKDQIKWKSVDGMYIKSKCFQNKSVKLYLNVRIV